jgi:hypothetical protein
LIIKKQTISKELNNFVGNTKIDRSEGNQQQQPIGDW